MGAEELAADANTEELYPPTQISKIKASPLCMKEQGLVEIIFDNKKRASRWHTRVPRRRAA